MNKEKENKRYTKKDVKKAIINTKRRLKTFNRASGIDAQLDEDYFLNLQPKRAIEALEKITNRKLKSITQNKHINLVSEGVGKHGPFRTVLKKDKEVTNVIKDIIKSRKNQRKLGMEETKPQFWGAKGKPTKKITELFRNMADINFLKEKKENSYKNALNNFCNNLENLSEHTGDKIYKALAILFKEKVEKGEIPLKELSEKLKKLRDVKINLFDSDVLARAEVSGTKTIIELQKYFPITKKEIEEKLKEMGYTKEEIEEAFAANKTII